MYRVDAPHDGCAILPVGANCVDDDFGAPDGLFELRKVSADVDYDMRHARL